MGSPLRRPAARRNQTSEIGGEGDRAYEKLSSYANEELSIGGGLCVHCRDLVLDFLERQALYPETGESRHESTGSTRRTTSFSTIALTPRI